MTSEELQERVTLNLMKKLEGLGSTLYSETWKAQVTPAQRLLFRLRASVVRTSATDYTGWVTPAARDWKDTPGMVAKRDGRERLDQLPRQAYMTASHPLTVRLTASGEMLTGCSAGMNGGGPLNPEHSRWLMGYRAAWGFCGDMAMRSIRGSRQRSSKPLPDQSST